MRFDEMVCREMRKKTTEEWIGIFGALGIWHTPVNEYDDVVNDAQVIHNQYVMTMEHPVAGTVKVLGHANRYDGAPLPLRKLPPELGDATRDLMRECGFTDEEMDRYKGQNKMFFPDVRE